MALKLKVSNIACEGCAEIITESIHVMEPDAKVDSILRLELSRWNPQLLRSRSNRQLLLLVKLLKVIDPILAFHRS
jgi:copper chaperone CopZ